MQQLKDLLANPYVHTFLGLGVMYVLPAALHAIFNPTPGSRADVILTKMKGFGFDPSAFERAASAEAKALVDGSGK